MDGLSRIRHTAKMLKKAQAIRDVKAEEEDGNWEPPRNARPRDVRFDFDSDSDGSAARRDDEALAAATLADVTISGRTRSDAEDQRGYI